jgi:hypothetical protein
MKLPKKRPLRPKLRWNRETGTPVHRRIKPCR